MRNKHTEEEEYSLREDDGFDNKRILRFLGRILVNWYWFILFGAIGFGIAYLQLRYTIPDYKVHAKLLVADGSNGSSLASTLLGELSGGKGIYSSVENEMMVLRTGDLMRDMVREQQAFISFFHQGNVHRIPLIDIPYTVEFLGNPDSIGAGANIRINAQDDNMLELQDGEKVLRVKNGELFNWPGVGALKITKKSSEEDLFGGFGIQVRSLNATAGRLAEALSVTSSGKNVSTIDLTLVDQIPARGRFLLEQFIDKYIQRNLEDKSKIADSTLSFINARLQKVTDELAGVEDRISGYKQSNKLFDISSQSQALLQNSTVYTNSLAEIETQLAALEEIAVFLQDTRNPRVVPSVVMPQDPSFASLMQRYNELVMQREKLLLGNTEDNPLVKSVTEQLAAVRKDMVDNIASARRQMELAKQKQLQLSNRVSSQML